MCMCMCMCVSPSRVGGGRRAVCDGRFSPDDQSTPDLTESDNGRIDLNVKKEEGSGW